MLESIDAPEEIRVGYSFQCEGANRDRSGGIPRLSALCGRSQWEGEAARRHEKQEEVSPITGSVDTYTLLGNDS